MLALTTHHQSPIGCYFTAAAQCCGITVLNSGIYLCHPFSDIFDGDGVGYMLMWKDYIWPCALKIPYSVGLADILSFECLAAPTKQPLFYQTLVLNCSFLNKF